MRREPAAFLWDVRDAASRIRSFVAGIDREGFLANALVQSAVERQFEIIGEALRQLGRSSPDLAARIPAPVVSSPSATS